MGQDYLITSRNGKFQLERRSLMKTRKIAEMTEEEKLYDDLRQAYGVQRSPAMMKLLKFFFPTIEEAEIGKHLENLYVGGKAKTIAEIAKETGKNRERVKQIVEGISGRIIIKWREREGEPGIREYYNTGSRGLKNAWGHVGRDDAEGQTFRGIINKVLDEQGGRLPKFKPRTLMIDKTINAETRTLPYEIASEIIKWKFKAGTSVGIMWCNCRLYRRKCDRKADNCIAFGPLADFYVEAAKSVPGARPVNYVSEEEALKCLEESFKQGLVAQVMTTTTSKDRDTESIFKDISGICMCCSCCCEQLSRYVEWGDVGRLPEFVPECDQDKCTLCEVCVKICPVKARWHKWPVELDLSDDFIFLDAEKCIGCGLCAYNCSTKALTMVRARELKPEPT
jgi:Pyruvate/2-oxoacid:ferredoxin oxidoreductase delta subunit